jgi:hypothetical protein
MTVALPQIHATETRVRQLQAYYGWHDGDPEGEVDAPRGAVRTDRLTGDIYRKTTELGTLTGWDPVPAASSVAPHTHPQSEVTNLPADLAAKAPLASPALTGIPTAPSAAADTNTTQLATTAFVLGQAGSSTPAMNGTAAVGSSLRFARQDHVHPTDTSRAPTASPTFTGTPTAPTAAVDTNTTQLATTAFVLGQKGTATPAMNGTAAAGSSLRFAPQDHVHPTDTSRAPTASPTFTGTAAFAAAGLTIGGDVNLYRSAADYLKTDDNFVSAGLFVTGRTALVDGGSGVLSYFGAGGATKQTVTGSRGGNAALASLLTALAAYGEIVNSTTA